MTMPSSQPYQMWLGLLIFICIAGFTDSQVPPIAPEREVTFFNQPTYFIIAPTRIYPNEELQLSVSILRLKYSSITIRASIKQGGVEYANAHMSFDRESTRLLQMKLPQSLKKGNYTLRVEGSIDGAVGNFIFQNESRVEYYEKQLAMFIQTSREFYINGQTVYFRIVPLQPNMMSASGGVDVYVVDATDTEVRRWIQRQTTSGVLDMSFKLSAQVAYGTWKIRVVAHSIAVYEKEFQVIEGFFPRFDVNVTSPNYIMERGWGLPVIIEANDTASMPIRGNASVYLTIYDTKRSQNRDYTPVVIHRDIREFLGRREEYFTMEEIRAKVNGMNYRPEDAWRLTYEDRERIRRVELEDYEIKINVTIASWWNLVNATGYSYTYIYGSKVRLEFLGGTQRTFKPGMPYTAYLAAFRVDGSPLKWNDSRQISFRKYIMGAGTSTESFEREIFVLPDSGIITYTFTPPVTADRLQIAANYEQDLGVSASQAAMRVYSPSNSYIQITTSTINPKVNEYMVFTVRCNNYVEYVYYQILAAARIIVSDRLAMTARQKTFSIALSRDMAPSARMFVWYLRPDGEVVTDALNFYVNATEMYPIEVQFNKGKDFSGATIEITAKTEPGSYISFAGIGYDAYIRGVSNFITEDEVVRTMSQFDSHANGTFRHTWRYGDDYHQTVYYPAPSFGLDANRTFKYAGLMAFTDANITSFPHRCNETEGYLPCFSGQRCYMLINRCDGKLQCEDGADEMGCREEIFDTRKRPLRNRRNPVDGFKMTRKNFLDTSFLWRSSFVKADGMIQFTTKVPNDIPKAWVVNAFAISRTNGFALSPKPIMFDAVEPFIMIVEMPSTARFGEQIGVRVALFNYWDDYYEVLVTLHESKQYKMVNVEPFGRVTSYDPRTSFGQHQTLLYLEARQSARIYFAVLPVVQGALTVTVSASTFLGKDTVTLPLFITYNGVENYYHTPYLVDLMKTGSNLLPDFWVPVPEQFIKPEQKEHLYVPGSGKAEVRIVGDIVGPGFFQKEINAWNMLRKPFQTGESSVYNLAINTYYLEFFRRAKQTNLDKTVRQQAIDAMNSMLQRVMSYYNPDEGFFTNFRDSNIPSLWMSAFTLSTLQATRNPYWEYDCYIPVELLNKLTLWICKQQDEESGAFRDVGPLFDQKMRSNITTINGVTVNSNLTITAYVLIALKEANALTGAAAGAAENAIQRAANYISKFVQQITDPFQMSIVAYALTVTQHAEKGAAYSRLRLMKIDSDDFIYWSNVPINTTNATVADTRREYKPRHEGPWDGYATQSSAYALMTYLLNNDRDAGYPIMRWLVFMRNTIGGQASTQDSVMALRALTEYARTSNTRSLYNVMFTVKATSTSDWKQDVYLNNENFEVLKSSSIPNVWGYVRVEVKGTGLATLSLDTTVNVEYSKFLKQPYEEYFTLSLRETYFSGRNYSVMRMRPCARYIGPGGSSGAAVIEVEVPSGFHVLNSLMKRYSRSGAIKTLKDAWFTRPWVRFFFDNITTEEVCPEFMAWRWWPVANVTREHVARVYDYYEPGRYKQVIYNTYQLFYLSVCHVCGSFQCPYCPDCNSSSMPKISLGVMLACVLLAVYRHYNER